MTWGEGGQGKTDRLTPHLGGGGECEVREQSGNNFDPKCSFGLPQVPQRVPEETSGIP